MSDESCRSSSTGQQDIAPEENYSRSKRKSLWAPQLQKMNYEEAKKAFFSSVSGRTRSKRDVYLGISAKTQGINISSSDSVRKQKRKRQTMPAPSVGGQRKIAATSWKKVGAPSNRASASVEISPEYVSRPRFRVQEGIEVIDKAEFISRKSFSTSKMRSSSKEKMKGISSSATPKKDASNASKRVASDDYCESFSPQDVGHGSDHARSHIPSSVIQIESDSDDTIPEDIEIQRLDEAELRNQNTHLKSNIGQSETEGLSTARLSKNVGGTGARKNIVSAHHSMTFTPRDYSTGSDTLAHDSTTLADKANNNEDRSFREITSKRNSEGVLKKGKSPYLQADRSRSSAQKVNRYEDRDHEQPEIEMINESEFRKWKRQFVSKIGSSFGQEQDEEHIAATSEKNAIKVSKKRPSSVKNDRNKKKRKASDSALKRKGEAWNQNVDDDDDDVDTSSDESLCSSSSTESDSDDVSASLQETEGSLYGTELEIGVGIANRTRRKMGSIKKALEVSSVSLDSSTDSDSSPTDNESDSSFDANFQVEGSDSDIELSSLCVRAKKKTTDMAKEKKVPAEAKEAAPSSQSNDGHDHSHDGTKERTEAAMASDSPLHAKDKPAGMAGEKKVTAGAKDKPADMASEKNVTVGPKKADPPSHSKDVYDHSGDGTNERTEVTSSDSHVHAKKKTADIAIRKKVPTGAKEAAPSSQSNDGHNGTTERTEAATSSDSHLCAKDNPEGVASEKNVTVGPKKAAPPSHSKDVYNHSGDGTKERTEVTGSDSHVHAKKKTADIAIRKKVPTGAKEADPSSNSNDGHNGTTERTEAATSSDSHLCAKDKPEGVASEKNVTVGPKKAAPPSHSKDVYNHSGDGTKERTEVTDSDSHVHAKKKTADIARKKVPTGAKEADPSSNSNDGHNGTTERNEAATSSDSHLCAKNKPEGVASGKNVSTRPKKAAPPSHSKDVYDHTDEGTDHTDEGTVEITEAASSCSHDHAQTEAADMADETEVMRRKKLSKKDVKDLCSVLADAVLGNRLPTNKEVCEETKQAPAPQTPATLPLKFRFEDEVPEPVEKTEYEKEIDNLFSELDCEWALEEVQSFDYPEDSSEDGNSPPGETQHARCSRGKHELVLEDDEGLICIFCHHVELGPKDVMPEWAERPYRDSERKKSHQAEQLLEFDEFHLPTIDVDAAGSSSNATGTVWNIKPGVRESMYEHQREGFEFLWKNLAGSIDLDELKSSNPVGVGGCIISHAPGTGKTRLTIVFIETYFKMFPDCRPVIISPASTLLNWEEEFKKWNVEFPFHNLSNIELSGKEKKTVLGFFPQTKSRDGETTRMIKICSWSMGGGILGISYSLFEKLTGDGERNIKDKRKIRKILLETPGLVVLDEGHTPRNSRSNIWNVLLKLQTDKRIILSGTPFQNNFSELFNTLRIVRPAIADVLAEEKMFAEAEAPRRKSSSSKEKNKREHAQSSLILEDVERLKACMSPFVHLHGGNILKQSLPGLRDCVILLKPPALQKSVIETIETSSNFKYEHEVAMLSVHPYLLLKCETTESRKIGVDMAAVEASKLSPQEGIKTMFLMELVRLSIPMKERVLVFSQYIQPLELIKEQLKEIFKWAEGKEILHIKGRNCQKQRQLLINLFNNPHSESKIMLASTKCCSEGISMVGASRVVLLDVVWNPSVERQAICRAYRIGQKKIVHTYHLMTSGTSEDDKYCRQAAKEHLSKLVFSSSNESNQQKQTSSSIEDRILEVMIANDGLKGMFEKIINQPKDTNLIDTFGLTD